MSISQLSIITGSTRGYGRAIAHSLLNFSKPLTQHFIILIGRSELDLNQVKLELQQIKSENLKEVRILSGVEFNDDNLVNSKFKELDNIVEELVTIESFKSNIKKIGILFNNHGTLGDLTKQGLEFNYYEVQNYTNINFTSFVGTCSYFSTLVKKYSFDNNFIINTSSLAAVLPVPYQSMYCSIKAARDMFINVLAKEQEKIKVLNYAPGPMEGDMQVELRTKLGHEESKKMFQSMFNENKLVKMEDSSAKLMNLIQLNQFQSGDHIDYFDDILHPFLK